MRNCLLSVDPAAATGSTTLAIDHIPTAVALTITYIAVSSAGNDANGHGTSTSPYGTIAHAVAAGGVGSTISVGAGTFADEAVSLADENLVGAGPTMTMLTSTGSTIGVTSTGASSASELGLDGYFNANSHCSGIIPMSGTLTATDVKVQGCTNSVLLAHPDTTFIGTNLTLLSDGVDSPVLVTSAATNASLSISGGSISGTYYAIEIASPPNATVLVDGTNLNNCSSAALATTGTDGGGGQITVSNTTIAATAFQGIFLQNVPPVVRIGPGVVFQNGPYDITDEGPAGSGIQIDATGNGLPTGVVSGPANDSPYASISNAGNSIKF